MRARVSCCWDVGAGAEGRTGAATCGGGGGSAGAVACMETGAGGGSEGQPASGRMARAQPGNNRNRFRCIRMKRRSEPDDVETAENTMPMISYAMEARISGHG